MLIILYYYTFPLELKNGPINIFRDINKKTKGEMSPVVQ